MLYKKLKSTIAGSLLGIAAALMLFSCDAAEDTSPALTETASNVWKFRAGTDSLWKTAACDDAAWQEVTTDRPLSGYNLKTEQGLGWYRKTVTLTDDFYRAARSKGGVILQLDSLAGADTLYINGHLAGYFSFAKIVNNNFLARRYFIPAAYLKQGDNLIALQFFDGFGPFGGGLLKGARLTLSTAETADKLALDVTVADSDYIFILPDLPRIVPGVTNSNTWAVAGDLVVTVTTDDYLPVRSDTVSVKIKAGTARFAAFTLEDPAPGFYRYTVQFLRNDSVELEKKFNLGFEPEKISSPPDARDDFKAFWDDNLKRLAAVKPQYKLTPRPEFSNADYTVYLVEMRSLGNTIIRGYYAKPTREGTFPVIVEYMGYGSNAYPPNTQWDGYARYIPSVRGQGLNRLTKEDDFWITIGLRDKEGYYYQGAYCDVVRAIDFVCSRPEIDADRIAVRGGSQGGALSFVAAALDRRVKACAPNVPFLSDYRDYFKIVDWPRSDLDNYAKTHPGFDWEHVYDLLTYFDIKNLAQWIECPLWMAIGVQDATCPPHINFAAYNQVKSEKQWIASPTAGHNIPDAAIWEQERQFISEKLKVKSEQ